MSLDIAFRQHTDHLLCEVSGSYSLYDFYRLADRIWQECGASTTDRVLVNLTAVDGTRLPAFDRYQLGVYCADKPRAVRKLAVVARQQDITCFFEDVAVNRGLNARVSASVAAAEHWLRKAA
jgi:hypothetical protein